MGTYAHLHPEPVFNERPFEDFLERLCRDSEILGALRYKFGKKTDRIVNLLIRSADPPKSTWEAFDLIRDMLHNDAQCVAQWMIGEYPIRVRGLGETYFVQELEGGMAGYFGSIAEAEKFLAINWAGEARKAETNS